MNYKNGWAVGSNGNFFRDIGDSRYCVAHEILGYLDNGCPIFKFSANRNGHQIGQHLHDTKEAAMRECEKFASTRPA